MDSLIKLRNIYPKCISKQLPLLPPPKQSSFPLSLLLNVMTLYPFSNDNALYQPSSANELFMQHKPSSSSAFLTHTVCVLLQLGHTHCKCADTPTNTPGQLTVKVDRTVIICIWITKYYDTLKHKMPLMRCSSGKYMSVYYKSFKIILTVLSTIKPVFVNQYKINPCMYSCYTPQIQDLNTMPLKKKNGKQCHGLIIKCGLKQPYTTTGNGICFFTLACFLPMRCCSYKMPLVHLIEQS